MQGHPQCQSSIASTKTLANQRGFVVISSGIKTPIITADSQARGIEYDLICSECKKKDTLDIDDFQTVCIGCFHDFEMEGCWDGISGAPQVFERSSDLHFVHESVDLHSALASRLLDIQPIDSASSCLCVDLTDDGNLFRVDLARCAVSLQAHVPESFWQAPFPLGGRPDSVDWPPGEENKKALHLSKDGRMAAVVNTKGHHGVVMDLDAGSVTMHLERDDCHSDVSSYPVAFLEDQGRLLLVHGTAWNRLDISDSKTGELITSRGPTSYQDGENRPKHYLDYFHSSLTVSPNQEFVADNGWCWHPVGMVTTWNLRRWLQQNIWESDDSPTKKYLCQRAYYWDGPLCWIDDRRLAVWGYGADDKWLIPAVCIFDVESGEQDRWFAGPKGSMVFDEYLFSFCKQDGMSIWDIASGERLLRDASFCPLLYHRGAKRFLTILPDQIIQISRLAGGV